MAQSKNKIEVYLETGQTRTFAVALAWPGWARSGRDGDSALQTLFDYGPRYARVLESTDLGFRPPEEMADLVVIDRIEGNATTDFGAPAVSLPRDSDPIKPAEVQRWEAILNACWQAFDSAVESAIGKTLRKGPRGGGRDREKIVRHVREVDIAYLKSLGGKLEQSDASTPDQEIEQIRYAIRTTLHAAARGEVPARGPLGGARWSPRYFIRRLAWHELDHAWEIEDRAE